MIVTMATKPLYWYMWSEW